MNINISDFLPNYPNINLDNFYESIFKKKEFYDEKLSSTEDPPSQKGQLMKHQKIISRFLSSYTLYDSLLLVHTMGSGKTCSAIGSIEKIKNENNNFKGVYVFAKGVNILDNFIKELRDKCTAGEYVPEGYNIETGKGLTEIELIARTKKLYKDYYHFTLKNNKHTTFQTTATYLENLKDKEIENIFSNHIIVLDEVHNLRESLDSETDKKETKDLNKKIYTQFHRLLHLVKNVKILLLTGTPMKDTPDEIASIMNLILPENEQLPTGKSFIKEYLLPVESRTDLYIIKENKKQELKEKFKGRVSFVKAVQSSVKKEFVGVNIGTLDEQEEEQEEKQEEKQDTHLIVEPVRMSRFQTEAYEKALEKDKMGGSGVYSNTRQASLFVFPDGSYGGDNSEEKNKKIEKIRDKEKNGKITKKEAEKKIKTLTDKISSGFYKYVKTSETKKKISQDKDKVILNYTLNKDLIKAIQGTKIFSTNNETNNYRLKNLSKYSCKYASVIDSILKAKNKCCFVYSKFVTGSGSILFAKILELFTIDDKNFTEYKGKELGKGIRYGLLTSETSSSKKSLKIINRFNKEDNKNGHFIKVLIGSQIVSEGVSFYNIQEEYILTPWFNYSETDQAIARGYRLGSHKALENAEFKIHQLVAIPKVIEERQLMSIDLSMYKTSEDKDISIQRIMRLLMESAFDCALNYNRNHTKQTPLGTPLGTPLDGSRECEYQNCDYICDGFDGLDGLDNKEDKKEDKKDIDYSTYQLYYFNPVVNNIHKKLNTFFKTYNNVNIDNIITFFKNQYSEQEIRNALQVMLDKKIDLNLENYNKIYSKNNIKNEIEDLFKHNFSLHFNDIIKNFPDNTVFEILTTLKNIIDENIVIQNKYGFFSYLREKNNIYYLINNLLSEFSTYSEFPNIIVDQNFNKILKSTLIKLSPSFIYKLFTLNKKTQIFDILKTLPEEVQEILIEYCILSKQKNKKDNENIRDYILEYFKDYIYEIDGVFVFEKLNKQLRCLIKNSWTNCDDKYNEKIKEHINKKQKLLYDNPYGIRGTFEAKTGQFRIINIEAEKKAIEKDRKNKDGKIEKILEKYKKGKISKEEKDKQIDIINNKIDSRLQYTGLDCNKSWKKPGLYKIIVKNLKIKIPDKDKDYKNDIDIIDLKDELIESQNKIKPASNRIYTDEEIEDLNIEQLRIALYWTLTNTNNTYLCNVIKNWFATHNWNRNPMLTEHKIIKKVKDKNLIFTYIKLSQLRQLDQLKKYLEYPDVKKLDVKKYKKLVEEDKTWIFISLNNKIVGLIIMKNNNIIYISIKNQIVKKELAKEAIKSFICSEYKDYPRIVIDTTQETDRLIQLYTSYGFQLMPSKEKTIMEFKCK